MVEMWGILRSGGGERAWQMEGMTPPATLDPRPALPRPAGSGRAALPASRRRSLDEPGDHAADAPELLRVSTSYRHPGHEHKAKSEKRSSTIKLGRASALARR